MPTVGTYNWANAANGHWTTRGFRVAKDSGGNVYAVGFSAIVAPQGSTIPSINLGGGSGEIPVPLAGKYFYIARYDSGGTYTGSRLFSGSVAAVNITIGIDSSDDIIIALNWGGATNFGDGPRNSQGFQYDSALIKYAGYVTDPTMTAAPVWVRTWFSLGGPVKNITAFGINSNKDIIMGWTLGQLYSGAVDFGDGNPYLTGFIFAKVSGLTGGTAWTKNFASSSPGGDTLQMLSCDPSNNIYASGRVNGPIDFGNGSSSSGGFFVIARTSNGARIWDKVVGSPSNFIVPGGTAAVISHVVEPTTNTLFLFGNFGGTVDFGGGPITTPYGQNGGLFASRYSAATGVYLPDAQCWGTGLTAKAFGIGSASGVCVFGGIVSGYVDWGNGMVYWSGGSAFVKMRPDGTIVWVSGQTASIIPFNTIGSFYVSPTEILLGGESIVAGSVYLPPFTLTQDASSSLIGFAASTINDGAGFPLPPVPSVGSFSIIIYPSAGTYFRTAPAISNYSGQILCTCVESLSANGFSSTIPYSAITFDNGTGSLPTGILAGTVYYAGRSLSNDHDFLIFTASTGYPAPYVDAGTPTTYVRKNNNDWLSVSVLQKIGMSYSGTYPAGFGAFYIQFRFVSGGGATVDVRADLLSGTDPYWHGVSLIKQVTSDVTNAAGWQWRVAFIQNVASPKPDDVFFTSWVSTSVSAMSWLGGSAINPVAVLADPKITTVQTNRGNLQTVST